LDREGPKALGREYADGRAEVEITAKSLKD
jgi:hypothetical protein